MTSNATPMEAAEPPRARGRPKAEDAAALDARLRQAGRELFFRHGYGAMTMHELATVAHVSKTTLYSRFPSKADLFRAIVAEQLERWGSGSERTPDDDCQTLLATLRLYGNIVLRAATTSDFAGVDRLLYSESGRFPELAEIAEARLARGVDYVAEKIEIFAEREGAPCRDPRAAAELFMAMVIGRGCIATLTGRPMSQDEREAWVDTMVRAFLSGRASW
jgi:AcrR family transcriptional regulator